MTIERLEHIVDFINKNNLSRTVLTFCTADEFEKDYAFLIRGEGASWKLPVQPDSAMVANLIYGGVEFLFCDPTKN